MDARNIDTWSKDLIIYNEAVRKMEDARKEIGCDKDFFERVYDDYLFFLCFMTAKNIGEDFPAYKKALQIQLLSIEEQLE